MLVPLLPHALFRLCFCYFAEYPPFFSFRLLLGWSFLYKPHKVPCLTLLLGEEFSLAFQNSCFFILLDHRFHLVPPKIPFSTGLLMFVCDNLFSRGNPDFRALS